MGMRMKGNSQVIPNGLDTNKFAPTRPRTTLNESVLFVGNLRTRKGLDDLAAASAGVIRHRPRTKFAFVGEGKQAEKILEIGASLGVLQNFELPGKVDDESLMRYYSNADVFVVPTRFDTYPTTVLEAMAFAKPVITTEGSVADVEGIVVDGVNGYLVSSGNIAQLAASILKIICDKDLSKKMGERGRKIIVDKYGLSAVRMSLERVFHDLVLNRTSRDMPSLAPTDVV
jgi:glycosyltransferase involved in cell wall biosynthesis